MARNDIVLLDSLIEKSKVQLGDGRDDSEIFELFTFDQLLKDYEPTFEELESGWVDGADDGGIDGFYVLIGGKLVTETDWQMASRWNPKIQVFLVTANRSDSFQQGPLNKLISSIPEVFDLRRSGKELRYPFNEDVLLQRELFRKAFIALADRRPHLTIELYYCCRGETERLADNITTRVVQLREQLVSLFGEAEAEVRLLGATELLNMARRQRTFSLRLKFTENFISRERNNYVVLCTLPDYFNFITDETGCLRRYLFESNVRDYLGEGKISLDIRATLDSELRSNQSDFWWFNNGITLLATHATVAGKELSLENVQIVNGLQTTETIYKYFAEGGEREDDRAILVKIILATDESVRDGIIEPFVVNGCQTTRTIWEVLYKKLEAGGTGQNPELETWKRTLGKGIVVIKIVKVGIKGEELLTETTRYTNSQNAVSEKDFLALESDFQKWSKSMAAKYNVFLEIQRGGWDSQKAYQKQHPETKAFSECINAFDLLKVYGAAWLGEDRLKEIKVPTLVMVGSDDHASATGRSHRTDADILAREIPNAKLAVIPGEAHNYFFTNPGEAHRIIREFLAT